MKSEVKLSRVESVLEDLEYPLSQAQAATRLDGVTLLLADGQSDLRTLVERSGSDRFESPEDLKSELHNVLPREAVGEPYQSEGEG
jgi:hypothetical protein